MSADWADFFAAQVGASAALLGLLFVGVSINLEKVLAYAGLADRALVALALLFNALLIASLTLVPGQPQWLLGVEVLAAGAVVWVVGTRLQSRALRGSAHAPRRLVLSNFLLLEFAALPFVIAGPALLLGHAAGFYAIAAGILVSFLKAVTDAWVLLIEINR